MNKQKPVWTDTQKTIYIQNRKTSNSHVVFDFIYLQSKTDINCEILKYLTETFKLKSSYQSVSDHIVSG